MPRYFFHLQDDILSLDEQGIEFPDVNTAREEAVRACGEIIREIPVTIRRGGEWRLWVTDQPDGSGNRVFTLTVATQNE